MAGISKAACIGLILKYIGGLPLVPALRTWIEGSMPAKQIGIPTMGLTGLTAFNSVLNGASLDSIVGNVFQNPIADLTANVTSSVNSAITSVTSLVGDGVTGALSAAQGELLNDALNQLKTENLNLESLTNKISGVELPNYLDYASEFGIQEVASVMNTAQGLTDSLATEVNDYLGDFTGKLNSTVSEIVEPLNFKNIAGEIDKEIQAKISELTTNPAKYSEVLSFVEEKKNMISGLVNNSIDSMNKVMDGTTVANQFALISATIESQVDSKVSELYNTVVKPDVLQKISSDNKIFKTLVKEI